MFSDLSRHKQLVKVVTSLNTRQNVFRRLRGNCICHFFILELSILKLE